MQIEGRRTVEVQASPAVVWPLVADVTTIGRWSPLTESARWLAPADGPAVGARFEGRNRLPIVRRWTSRCTVTACEAERRFAFDVGNRPGDPTTQWSYELEPLPGGGTRLTESWTMRREHLPVRVYFALIGQRERVARGVEATLAAIKAEAERRVA